MPGEALSSSVSKSRAKKPKKSDYFPEIDLGGPLCQSLQFQIAEEKGKIRMPPHLIYEKLAEACFGASGTFPLLSMFFEGNKRVITPCLVNGDWGLLCHTDNTVREMDDNLKQSWIFSLCLQIRHWHKTGATPYDLSAITGAAPQIAEIEHALRRHLLIEYPKLQYGNVQSLGLKSDPCPCRHRLRYDLREISQEEFEEKAPTWALFLSRCNRPDDLIVWLTETLFQTGDMKRHLWLYGPAGTLKSSLAMAISEILEDTVAFVDSTSIQNNAFALGHIPGHSLVVVDDCDYRWPTTHHFKSLTGSTKVLINRKYQKTLSLEQSWRYMFTANRLPDISRIRSEEDAVLQRLLFIEMQELPDEFDGCGSYENWKSQIIMETEYALYHGYTVAKKMNSARGTGSGAGMHLENVKNHNSMGKISAKKLMDLAHPPQDTEETKADDATTHDTRNRMLITRFLKRLHPDAKQFLFADFKIFCARNGYHVENKTEIWRGLFQEKGFDLYQNNHRTNAFRKIQ